MKHIRNLFKTPYVAVDTMDKYLALPLNQREVIVWWWAGRWYLSPLALKFVGIFNRAGNVTEWQKFEAYVKDKYPIQFFLRNTLYWNIDYLHRSCKDVYYKIKHRIRNPRSEMMKSVFPPEYQDLEEHIINFHIQCIIEFVEREDCFNVVNFLWSPDKHKFANELKDLYEYAKVNRARLQKDLDEAYERVPFDGPYDVVYKEVNEKEAWIKECDTKLCQWVIENRESLWT